MMLAAAASLATGCVLLNRVRVSMGGERLEELQGGTGRAGQSAPSSRPSRHAVFVHSYRPRSPPSSSSMHHERMAHILSPEVLPHPRSLLTRATFSRRYGVCSLCQRQGACLKSFTQLGLCLCVANAKSGMLREPCGALWSVVLVGPQLGQHGRPAVADNGVFSLPSRCAWGQEDLDQPDLAQRFPKVGTRATAGCASRLLLLWSQDDVERVSVNAERWDCQQGRLPTTRSRKVLSTSTERSAQNCFGLAILDLHHSPTSPGPPEVASEDRGCDQPTCCRRLRVPVTQKFSTSPTCT